MSAHERTDIANMAIAKSSAAEPSRGEVPAVPEAGGEKSPPRPGAELARSPLRITRHPGRPSSCELWDDVVSRSRDTWLYHRSSIAGALADPGSGPLLFVECRCGDDLLGGAILLVSRTPWHGVVPRRRMSSSIGPAWVSPFLVGDLDAGTAASVLDALMDDCVAAAREKSCEELVLYDSNQSLRCVEDRPTVNRYVTSTDWRHAVSYYWLLDLRGDEETLWKSIATSQRTQIKNARAKLQVLPGTELADGCAAFIDLMRCVDRREGFTLFDEPMLRHYWEEIYTTQSGQSFFCLADGKPCAVAGFGRQGPVAGYIHAGRRDDAMNGAAALALWSGILWAKAAGCRWFDLNSMIPERDRTRLQALSQFKKRFGGEVVLARGARIELARCRRATFDFIDALGAGVKGSMRTLAGRKGSNVSKCAAQVRAAPADQHADAPRWELVRRSAQPSSPEAWDQAVRDSRHTWLYHFSRLAPLFLSPRADPLTFLELRLDGQLVGGAIFDVLCDRWHGLGHEKTLLGQTGVQPVAPFLIDGHSLPPALAETAWERLLDGAADTARQMGCRDLILWDSIQSPQVIDDRDIVSRYSVQTGWSPLLAHNYVLDLEQDLDSLFKNVQSRRRTYIRRARERYQVVAGRDFSGGREAHVALMESMYAREGRVVVPREQLLRIWDEIYDGEKGEAIFLLQDGRPVTFTGVARFRHVASYLHGARIDDTEHGAHALGFWAGVEWAKAAGCRWFDCNAATFERRGRERMRAISEFKRGFGGFLVHCHGAKRPIPSLTRATREFVDAWGVRIKGLLRGSRSARQLKLQRS